MDSSDRMNAYLAKRERAQTHLDELGVAVERFVETEAHRVRVHLDMEEGAAYALSDALDFARETEWGLIAGDVLHSLRATLDHLAYQLGCLVHDPPTCKTEFPILSTQSDWKGSAWKVKCLDPDDQRVIQELQPSDPLRGWPDNPKGHPLWLLQQMDIDDKHKTLNVTAVAVSYRELRPFPTDLQIVGSEEFPLDRLKRGEVLARYEVVQTGENPDLEVQAYGSFSAIFGDGSPAEGQGLFKTLFNIRSAVDNVLFSFAPRFL